MSKPTLVSVVRVEGQRELGVMSMKRRRRVREGVVKRKNNSLYSYTEPVQERMDTPIKILSIGEINNKI